jgi:hypothetical protein
MLLEAVHWLKMLKMSRNKMWQMNIEVAYVFEGTNMKKKKPALWSALLLNTELNYCYRKS